MRTLRHHCTCGAEVESRVRCLGTRFVKQSTTAMATTSATPANAPHNHQRHSSHSRTRSANIPSRPTTPLRPPSRTSLRASQSTPSGNGLPQDFPLASLEPAFAELSDSMADLEANFMHLQLLNESLGRFNENFGAFLYGMNMSAFCVDFPEVDYACYWIDLRANDRRLQSHNPSPATAQHPLNQLIRPSGPRLPTATITQPRQAMWMQRS